MTKLLKAANPEELQQQLDRVFQADDEDRIWYLHGVPKREDGWWYQFLTDDPPNLMTIRLDPANLTKVIQTLKQLEET
jgi:hypothetical protein